MARVLLLDPAGLQSKSRPALRRSSPLLLISESFNRIDAYSPQRGHGARDHCGQHEHRADGRERHRIPRCHAEQKSRHRLRECERKREPNRDAHANHPRSAPQHEAEHVRRAGAKCDADTELARALLDGVRQHAKHPNHRERQREYCKRSYQHGTKARSRRGLTAKGLQRADDRCGAIPVDARRNKRDIVRREDWPENLVNPFIIKAKDGRMYLAVHTLAKKVRGVKNAFTIGKDVGGNRIMYVLKPRVEMRARFGFVDTVRKVVAEPSTAASGVFKSCEIEVSSAERRRSVSIVRLTRSMSSTSRTRSIASAL